MEVCPFITGLMIHQRHLMLIRSSAYLSGVDIELLSIRC